MLHGRGEEGVGGLGAVLVVVVPGVVLAVLQLFAEGGQGTVRQEGGAGGGARVREGRLARETVELWGLWGHLT